jgi:hypothetical protein
MTLSVRNEGPITLTAGEALERARFVKLSAGTVVYADAGDEPIGITSCAVASGEPVAIYPLKGTFEAVTAAKAITAGSAIYVANDGKVSDAAVGKQIGINIQASTANNGIITSVVWGPRGGNDVFSPANTIAEYFDDLYEYDPTATVGNFAVTEDAGADGGDVLDATLPNGVLSVGCDGDDNDECYVASINKVTKFQTDKKVYFEAKVKLTEANTDDANWCAGLCSVYAANTLVDNGAGLVTTFDGAMFYKVDGTMKIYFRTSNGAVQGDAIDMGTFVSGTWYTLGFLYDYNDGVTAKVTPYVNGVAGTTQNITISGLDALLHAVFGVKAGGANEEALKVDYVRVLTER